jgi:hypothetical protein
LVSKEYLDFFRKYYRASKPNTGGLTPDQRVKVAGKASSYLPRIKNQMRDDMEDLATLASILPEKHLAEVFTEENIDKLTSALLTESHKKTRKQDPNRQSMNEREYRIATVLMEKGLARCALQFHVANPDNRELYQFIDEETRKLAMILAAPERRSIITPLECEYNPNRYKAEQPRK